MTRPLRARLTGSETATRAAWTAGELLHRRLPAFAARARGRGDDDAPRPFDPRRATGPPHAVDPPTHPEPVAGVENPVLTAGDVTDFGRPGFVADPFLLPGEDRWHLFFEVFDRHRTPTAAIAHATSPDGLTWRYDGVVLATDDHIAFPYVFTHDGRYYMLPERWNRETPAPVTLFEATDFPRGWEPCVDVVRPERFLSDCVVFPHEGRWWALAGSDDGRHDLLAYHSETLLAEEWTPHAANPVVEGRPRGARPGGRPLVFEDGVTLVVQDCRARYGHAVRAYDIERLSPAEYADRQRPDSPLVRPTDDALGWNSGAMHHLDAWPVGDRWLCAVDGNVGLGRRLVGADHWALGVSEAPTGR
ncbi:glucosamine inositolphosphorylceramide transferase family protein [Halomarina ordinaria]|uniref:Glucosamine inositolphosphorylceramide transferase 1 N-terminal domain-containing protein n=1 Tax=Halomarina ordinaria TaxID=3033939 RepID=A0ABD5UAN8_9EURY|nr:hypothetical protein [Halomarina sp. PSRA2]